MSHIAVERNRRRQMNEHLKVLRALTPAMYMKRGDQASIIGGAIDFIRELQTVLDSLEAKKKRRSSPSPTTPTTCSPTSVIPPPGAKNAYCKELSACCNSPAADVEAKISGSNVLLRTLSARIPGQALKIIALLQTLHLEVLHLSISTMQEENTVLHSFVLNIGLDCNLSVDDLASEVHQTFCCHLQDHLIIMPTSSSSSSMPPIDVIPFARRSTSIIDRSN